MAAIEGNDTNCRGLFLVRLTVAPASTLHWQSLTPAHSYPLLRKDEKNVIHLEFHLDAARSGLKQGKPFYFELEVCFEVRTDRASGVVIQ